MNKSHSVGERIRRLRFELRWSQTRLATACHLASSRAISKLENDETKDIRLDLLETIAEVAHVSPCWLILGIGTMHERHPLDDIAAQLTPERRKALDMVARSLLAEQLQQPPR